MRQKYEREIDEILSKFDDAPAPPRRVQSPVLTPAPRIVKMPRPRPTISPSALMVAALAIAVFTYPLQWIFPPVVAVAGIIAVVLLVSSLALSVTKWGRSRTGPVWRGRQIDTSSGSGIGTAIVRRWRRWRAHRRFHDTRWN